MLYCLTTPYSLLVLLYYHALLSHHALLPPRYALLSCSTVSPRSTPSSSYFTFKLYCLTTLYTLLFILYFHALLSHHALHPPLHTLLSCSPVSPRLTSSSLCFTFSITLFSLLIMLHLDMTFTVDRALKPRSDTTMLFFLLIMLFLLITGLLSLWNVLLSPDCASLFCFVIFFCHDCLSKENHTTVVNKALLMDMHVEPFC